MMWELGAQVILQIVKFVFGRIEMTDAQNKAYVAFVEHMSAGFGSAKLKQDYKEQLEELKNGTKPNPK